MGEFNKCTECDDIFEDNYDTSSKCPACFLPEMKAENEALKKCNACMRHQLDKGEFDCCCSLDGSCAWDSKG